MENPYTNKNLVKEQVVGGNYRQFVGGKWDELGSLQFEYLKSKGLKPHHKLLDVGCGVLRGGVYFIPYLAPLHYFGFDLNMSLIQIGLNVEVENLDLSQRVDVQNFAAAENFEYPPHWPSMDMAVGFSLLTHLNYKSVCLCLKNTAQILRPGGKFYATIFEVTDAQVNEACVQAGGVISYPLKDPYHYTRKSIEEAADTAGLTLEAVEDFSHPRNQKMAIFERI